MKISAPWIPVALVAMLPACAPSAMTTPPPATAPPEVVKLTGASVLIGVGDIARCDGQGDEQTAALVDSVLKADSTAGVKDGVFTLGDNAYPDGSVQNFTACYGSSWGDSLKRIHKLTRPTPGNHEHSVVGAAPYYEYFGNAAGAPRQGYYSYDIGDWHVIALNSEIVVNDVFKPEDREAQETWLQDDLNEKKSKCTVAYFHHPRYSSGWHGSDPRLERIWTILYEAGVDLVLTGHDHHYERFAPLGPAGAPDTLNGIVQFIAGTGGGDLRGIRQPVPGSETRVQGHYGVLKLTLGAEEWQSAFLAVSGITYDPAGGKCHDAPG